MRPRLTHPDGTAYQRDLYTALDTPPAVATILEHGFFQLADDFAAKALHLMLAETPELPTGSFRAAWARFMLSLMYRTPENLVRSAEAVRKIYEDGNEELREVYNKGRRPTDPETFEEYRLQTKLGTLNRAVMNHIMTITNSSTVMPALMSMKWAITRPAKLHYPLLTSDRPMIMSDGIGRRHGNIVMPISQERVFICARSDEAYTEIKARSRQVGFGEKINDRVARQARKYVYGGDDRQLSFIENRLGEGAWCSPIEGAVRLSAKRTVG